MQQIDLTGRLTQLYNELAEVKRRDVELSSRIDELQQILKMANQDEEKPLDANQAVEGELLN